MTALQLSLGIDFYYNGEKLEPIYSGDTISWELPAEGSDQIDGDDNKQEEPTDDTPPVAFDPEKGLALNGTFAAGLGEISSVKKEEIPSSDTINRDKDAVLAMDLTDLDGSQGGLIFELGGVGLGSYIGFGKDGSFIVRCGVGSTDIPSDQAAYLVVPAKDAPKGDGTLVVELASKVNTVRAWWNGVELGAPVARKNGSGGIAGGGAGAYLAESSALSVGAEASPVAYGKASDLRYYFDQKVAS